MKIMVISDIHNDVPYTKAAIGLFRKEKFDKLYILGDILEDPIRLLNPLSDQILAVKGNCDSYEEEELARFPLPYLNYDYQFGMFIVMTHGHYYNDFNYDDKYDIFLEGHTHRSFIRKDAQGRIVANPGSLASPRDGYCSYMEIDEKGMKVKSIDSGALIHWLDF